MQTASAEQQTSITLQDLVKDVKALVSPPEICFKVFELIDSKHGTAEALGNVISQDPNLTAQLLKIVNSAYYNFPSRIDTVSRAVSIIGSAELYNMVVAVQSVRCFSKISADLINIDSFWQHSVYTGVIAKDIALHCKILHPERLFVAGLLHDIGSLVLFKALPHLSRDLLSIVDGDESLLAEKEKENIGFSHSEVGAELMKTWNLPETLQEATSFHHNPGDAINARFESAVLHLADSLANQTGMGTFAEEAPLEVNVDESIWSTLNLDPGELDTDTILSEAGLKFAEMSSLLLVKSG